MPPLPVSAKSGETGGSNIQFSTDPKTGRMVVIEMNAFPVVRHWLLRDRISHRQICSQIGGGYSLDELRNDVTKNAGFL